MTASEALLEIETTLAETDWYMTKTCKDAFDMAVEALKKQIPMEPPGTYTNFKCPVCGRRIRSGKGSSSYGRRDNFCQRCGQKIDWDNDDEVRLNGGN